MWQNKHFPLHFFLHAPLQRCACGRRQRDRLLRRAGPIMVLAALAGPLPVIAQDTSSPLSPAETLLFETDHLALVVPPAVLVYRFEKTSNVETGFSDEVRLDLDGSKGKVSATLHFLSGKNKHDLPALDEAHGNPVLLGFLERDIAEMKRLTGGSTAYFRKRIRMALAQDAQVTPRAIAWRGAALTMRAVRIQPYLNDPMHARFERYVNKTYTFIVSEQVPGGVYQLRSSLANRGMTAPGAVVADVVTAGTTAAQARKAEGAPPSTVLPEIDETLTLVRVAEGKDAHENQR